MDFPSEDTMLLMVPGHGSKENDNYGPIKLVHFLKPGVSKFKQDYLKFLDEWKVRMIEGGKTKVRYLPKIDNIDEDRGIIEMGWMSIPQEVLKHSVDLASKLIPPIFKVTQKLRKLT